MLIKITNYCSAGCSHCMENSTVQGEHMSADTFVDAIEWTHKMEVPAWALGAPKVVLISGGECSEHPNFVDLVEVVRGMELIPLIITNGQWLSNPKVRNAILAKGSQVFVQVTHDPRFCPEALRPVRIDDPRVSYVESLTALLPLGRLTERKQKKATDDGSLRTLKHPTSFNFRSLVRSQGSVASAIRFMRTYSATMAFKTGKMWSMCSPSISWDGSIHAGESNECWKIGTIYSTDEELTRATLDMNCNKCGLENNLDENQKLAIGLPVIYLK